MTVARCRFVLALTSENPIAAAVRLFPAFLSDPPTTTAGIPSPSTT